MTFTDLVRDTLATLEAAAGAIPRDIASHGDVADSDVLEFAATLARIDRLTGSSRALFAGEIAKRSAPSLGYAGLAQRTGYRTAEELVRVTTGQSRRDAATTVRVGGFLHGAADAAAPDPVTRELLEPMSPWLVELGRAVSAGSLSVAAADAIARGLGEPNTAVSVAGLRSAVAGLCLLARELDVDRLFRTTGGTSNATAATISSSRRPTSTRHEHAFQCRARVPRTAS